MRSSVNLRARRLGTPEALFLYHAGMIGNALDGRVAAKEPTGFDVRHAVVAQKTLAAIGPEGK